MRAAFGHVAFEFVHGKSASVHSELFVVEAKVAATWRPISSSLAALRGKTSRRVKGESRLYVYRPEACL